MCYTAYADSMHAVHTLSITIQLSGNTYALLPVLLPANTNTGSPSVTYVHAR